MATVAASPTYAGTQTGEHTGLWSWLTTVDHKRIGVLYLYTSLFFFLFGGLEAVSAPRSLVASSALLNSSRWASPPKSRAAV